MFFTLCYIFRFLQYYIIFYFKLFAHKKFFMQRTLKLLYYQTRSLKSNFWGIFFNLFPFNLECGSEREKHGPVIRKDQSSRQNWPQLSVKVRPLLFRVMRKGTKGNPSVRHVHLPGFHQKASVQKKTTTNRSFTSCHQNMTLSIFIDLSVRSASSRQFVAS